MVTLADKHARAKYRNLNSSEDSREKNEAEDPDVFEITDFTTASDWERIIARLEDVIHDWKLTRIIPETNIPKDWFVNGKWKETTTDITDVPDFEFLVKHVYLRAVEPTSSVDSSSENVTGSPRPGLLSKTCFSVDEFPAVYEQMLSTENDFPLTSTVHPLARWFGIANFLVISRSPFNKIDQEQSEDRLKLLQSSMCVSVANTKCLVPVFLQFDDPARQMFFGVSEVGGYRTLYDVVDLEKIPDRLQTLSGLVELFKGKIGLEESVKLIKTSIQLTVKLSPDEVDFPDGTGELPENPSVLGMISFGSLEYFSFFIQLFASWPNANADAVEDTLNHSDLDPLQAPKWAAQLVLNEKAPFKLAETIKQFAKQTHRRETVKSFLEFLDQSATSGVVEEQAAEALDRLTGHQRGQLRSRLSKAFYSRLPKYHLPVPIDTDSLNELLGYLFPDSDLAKDVHRDFPELLEVDETNFPSAKAAPCNSLPFKLSLAVSFVYDKFGGLLAVAYLWQEVILELRYRWENGFVISGVEPGSPNHGMCLLYQKLQMLNCCIAKRELDRSAVMYSGSTPTNDSPPQGSASSTSIYFDTDETEEVEEEEEFFDCSDVPTDMPGKTYKPEGRQQAHPSLMLLSDKLTPMFIPVTQEPAPMTEDAVHEQLEKMVAAEEQGGDGRAERVRLQSVALVSDMSAFKAANPGCCFADFVRWHSPRDWEEDDSELGGHLSERMGQPASAWLQAWESALVKSVRRQKRLFDERVEAEKALAFFNMNIGDVFRQLLPMFLKAAVIRLCHEIDLVDLKVPHDKKSIAKSVANLFVDQTFNWMEFERILKAIRLNEQLICAYRTLHDVSKRSMGLLDNEGFEKFLQKLIESRQLTNIPGGARSPIGQHLAATFDQSTQLDESVPRKLHKYKLPEASCKEFILRTVAPRPCRFSRPGVHRLYASFRQNEVRIAGAFTEDLLYG